MRYGFSVKSPVGQITCDGIRWANILIKHPVLTNREADVQLAISDPDEVRRSNHDARVALCYRKDGDRLLCAVIRPDSGILVTAYPADKVKEGELLWTRSA